MSVSGFSIESLDFAALETRLKQLDAYEVYQRAVRRPGDHLGRHLGDALRSAGASEHVLDALDSHGVGGLEHVGVAADSSAHDEASLLEYGDHRQPPQAWLRGTLDAHGAEVRTMFANDLTDQMWHAPVDYRRDESVWAQ